MSGPGCVYTTVSGAVCNADATHRVRKAPNGSWFHLCPTHTVTVESSLGGHGRKVDKEELT